jgi:hypothetical protein
MLGNPRCSSGCLVSSQHRATRAYAGALAAEANHSDQRLHFLADREEFGILDDRLESRAELDQLGVGIGLSWQKGARTTPSTPPAPTRRQAVQFFDRSRVRHDALWSSH